MSTRWTPQISLLGRCHLAMLACCAFYLVCMYSAALPCILVMLIAAVFSEAMPPLARRWLAGEGLLIATGAWTWWAFAAGRPDVLDGWLRMLVAYWLLVPSRPGLLRWTLSLVLAEALALGSGAVPVAEWRFGTGVFGQTAVLALPLLGLVPLAALSIGLDAWVSGRLGARNRQVDGAVWRFALGPAALVVGIALILAPTALPHGERIAPRLPPDTTARSGIQRPMIAPGDHQWVQNDPSMKGRLLWEDATMPLVDGVAYIRAFTLPQLVVDGPLIRWEAAPLDQLRRGDGGFDETKAFAWIVRMPIGNDAVLVPEPGFGADVDDLFGDRFGNRYAGGLDAAPRAYRVNVEPVDLGDERDPIYLEIPPAVGTLAWGTLIPTDWERLRADDAAAAVTAFLNEACSYSLENLPKPSTRDAGLLQTFLWSEDPQQRRGHCQYFASAAAVILRQLGHPTRCVAGFATTERDVEGYTFRGLHAHAWIEVMDEAGRWFRCDPTPPAYHSIRNDAPMVDDPTNVIAPPSLGDLQAEAEKIARQQARSRRLAAIPILIVILAGIAILVWHRLSRRRGPPKDPLRERLDREVASLERLAGEMGIAVTPSTTLSDLAERLAERSGLDLDTHLRDHLRARYGQGPEPRPWPIDELRAAVRRKSEVSDPLR